MLDIWVIYDSPRDFSGEFVARKWRLDQPTDETLRSATLDSLRAKLPQGLYRLDRSPQDDFRIVESWL